MKFAGLKTSLLFLSGFSVGVVLFYLQFRRGIVTFIKEREQELKNKKQHSEPNCNDSLSLPHLQPEQKSVKFERFFKHSRKNTKNPTHQIDLVPVPVPVEKVQDGAGTDLNSTGETIRQNLGTDNGDPIPFHHIESCQTLQSESSMDFVSEIVSCYPSEFPVFKNKSSFSSVCHMKNQTKCLPIFSTSGMDNKLKMNKSAPRKLPRDMDENDFEIFAKERLKMPSTVFVTPYPLHIMYRKLRKSVKHFSQTYPAFYHPLIIPEHKTTVNLQVNPRVNPRGNPTINPRGNPTVNPRGNPTVHSRVTPQGNPTFNPTINTRVNLTINPRVNPTVNTRVNPTINPRVNLTINPRVNPTINPRVNLTINPRVRSFHIFQNSLYNEKYGPDLDWRSVHPNDYQLDSKLSLQFRELVCKLIDRHVCKESWVESYYCPPTTRPLVTQYIVGLDLPQYKRFIQPLCFDVNSKISHFISEYYKIVQKPF